MFLTTDTRLPREFTLWDSEALSHWGGNKIEAAHRLGVSRATLYRFIEESEKTGNIKAV